MPNLCENKATIRHPNHDLIKSLVAHYNQSDICETLLPPPADMYDGDIGSYRINNWGCKWDIGAGDYGVETECYPVTPTDDPFLGLDKVYEMKWKFLSPWAPPLGLYEYLITIGCVVEAYYLEPGMAFCGSWINGEEKEYDYVEDIPASIEIQFPELAERFAS